MGLGFLFLFMRAPRLLLEGRVYCEEGTTYLRYGWDAAARLALFAPHQGYYSLPMNLIAMLPGRLVPLEWAPMLFTWTAAAVYLLMLYLAVTSVWIKDWRIRLVAVVSLCLVTPNFEVWLTLVDIQFILPVCCGILLTEEATRRSLLQFSVLLVSGLTGVTSCVLAPLFWFRAWQQRSKASLLQASMLTVLAAVQVLVVEHEITIGARIEIQHHLLYIGPMLIARMFIHHFMPKGMDVLYDRALAWGGVPLQLVLLAVAIAFVWLLFRVAKAGHEAALLLVTAALLSFGLSWYGCTACDLTHAMLSTRANGRYFFASNALVTFALLIVVSTSRQWPRRAAWVALVASMTAGSIHYVRDHATLVDYVAWRPQITAWRRDAHQNIRVAPNGCDQPLVLTPSAGHRLELPSDIYDSSRPH